MDDLSLVMESTIKVEREIKEEPAEPEPEEYDEIWNSLENMQPSLSLVLQPNLNYEEVKVENVLEEAVGAQSCHSEGETVQEAVAVSPTGAKQMLFDPKEPFPCGSADAEEEEEDEAKEEGGEEEEGVVMEDGRLCRRGERRVQCDTCKRWYGHRGTLIKHIRYAHLRERPFACARPGCGLTFFRRDHLAAHTRAHDAHRPFPCPHPPCVKAFASQANAVIHARTHTGERPFKCVVAGCGKGFTTASHLAAHATAHRQRRDFECALCGKRFASKARVRTHLQNYQPCTSLELDEGCIDANRTHNVQLPRAGTSSQGPVEAAIPKSFASPAIRRLRKNPTELEEASKLMTDAMMTLIKVLQKPQVLEDDCDRYGKILANKLRELRYLKRLQLMFEIDGLYIKTLQNVPSPAANNQSVDKQFE